MMTLDWIKCQGNNWCSLNNLNLDSVNMHAEGVYIIWYWGSSRKVTPVYVGQGNIRERLTAHRNDPRIQNYAQQTLYVTWAHVSKAEIDGVEAYLGETLNPTIGKVYPQAIPISVNLPLNFG